MLRRVVSLAARQSNAVIESFHQRLIPCVENVQRLQKVATSASAGPDQATEKSDTSSAEAKADTSDSDSAPEGGMAMDLDAVKLKVNVTLARLCIAHRHFLYAYHLRCGSKEYTYALFVFSVKAVDIAYMNVA